VEQVLLFMRDIYLWARSLYSQFSFDILGQLSFGRLTFDKNVVVWKELG